MIVADQHISSTCRSLCHCFDHFVILISSNVIYITHTIQMLIKNIIVSGLGERLIEVHHILCKF